MRTRFEFNSCKKEFQLDIIPYIFENLLYTWIFSNSLTKFNGHVTLKNCLTDFYSFIYFFACTLIRLQKFLSSKKIM